nr:DNA polymerase III subunit delta' [Pantoea sp. Ap-967]
MPRSHWLTCSARSTRCCQPSQGVAVAEAYPWQQAIWQQLAGRSRHAHAYLLHGPQGIGKRAMAERLMARLLCQKPQGLDACGQCKSCQLLKAGSHPDNFVLEPEEADKPIKIDQVRELVAFVVQTAQLGGRKVVLIEPVEAMNINASNALLKSLEEPSGDTVLILVSHQPSRLLPTIKSRCQQVACPQPTLAQSQAWLAEALADSAEAERDELLTLAAGSPLMAVSLQAQGVREQRALVTDGVKKLLKQQQSPSQLAEAWSGVPLLLLFDWFCDWSHLVLRYQLTQDEDGLGLADMRKVVQYLAQKSRQGKVLEVQAWILEQRQKVLGKANLNRVLLLEALLAHWVQLPGVR